MQSTPLSAKLSYIHDACLNAFDSVGSMLIDTTAIGLKKIKESTDKDPVVLALGHGIIGLGLGVGAGIISRQLSTKIFKCLGQHTNHPDPFESLGLGYVILSMPLVCVIGPILEEVFYRGGLQEVFKDKLKPFYLNRNFSDLDANTAACVTSIFFTSVIFGTIHLTDIFLFRRNAVYFLDQAVYATIWGLMVGLTAEASGALYMPIGMHIGNNTIAWVQSIKKYL